MKGVKGVRRQSSEPETADIKTVSAEASPPKEVGESQSRSERRKKLMVYFEINGNAGHKRWQRAVF